MTNKTKSIAWSHSAINSFLTCPRQYYEVKVLKRYSDDNEYNRWGDRVHKYFEAKLRAMYIGSDRQPLASGNTDSSLAIYDGIIERFSRIEGKFSAEQQLAVTNAFRPTSWFAPDVWCRGKADAIWINGNTGTVVDWKTGKRKFDAKQLILLALLTFAHHPQVDRINAGFMWLPINKLDVEKYKREDIPVLWQELLPDVKRFEQAHKTQTWIPKPSGLCRNYCPVLDCSFNEKGQRDLL